MQFDQALRCFERSGDQEYIDRTKASQAVREADTLRTMSQFKEAALKYEEVSKLGAALFKDKCLTECLAGCFLILLS